MLLRISGLGFVVSGLIACGMLVFDAVVVMRISAWALVGWAFNGSGSFVWFGVQYFRVLGWLWVWCIVRFRVLCLGYGCLVVSWLWFEICLVGLVVNVPGDFVWFWCVWWVMWVWVLGWLLLVGDFRVLSWVSDVVAFTDAAWWVWWVVRFLGYYNAFLCRFCCVWWVMWVRVLGCGLMRC